MEREDELFEAIKKIGESRQKETKEAMEKFADHVFHHGMIPKDALGLSDVDIERLYAEAYHHFNSGKYKDALIIFNALVALNLTEPKYLFGIAACEQMLGNFKVAADTYMGTAMLDPENPIPFFHASDCWMQINDLHAALVCLRMTVRRSGDNSAYSVIKDRCLMTIATLEKEIKSHQENASKGEVTHE